MGHPNSDKTEMSFNSYANVSENRTFLTPMAEFYLVGVYTGTNVLEVPLHHRRYSCPPYLKMKVPL